MDELRVIQNTTNVMPAQLVKCFLRFIGVYVHEGERIENTEGFLKDIYILDDQICYDQLQEGICIVTKKGSDPLPVGITEIVYVRGKERVFLKNFAREILVVNKSYFKKKNNESLFGLFTIKDMKFLADQFVDNKIMQNISLTKCFYKNPWFREDAEKRYKSFLNQLISYMEKNEGTVNKKTFLFVLLYTHYEMNCMYKKNDEPIHYAADRELEQCSYLLKKIGQNHIALRLLMGDILLELKGDTYEAYKNYIVLVPEKEIAYAWYKMGNVYSKVGSDVKLNNNYFIKATRLKENYYQAWYQLALGYERIKENERAVEAYKKVILELADKRQNGVLQPIEIEFIFKSFLRMEKIYSDCDNDSNREIWALKNEIQIIKEIEKQKFLDEILYGEKQQTITKIKYMINSEIRKRLEMSSRTIRNV